MCAAPPPFLPPGPQTTNQMTLSQARKAAIPSDVHDCPLKPIAVVYEKVREACCGACGRTCVTHSAMVCVLFTDICHHRNAQKSRANKITQAMKAGPMKFMTRAYWQVCH
jgi:hypothetical protein